jgi:hypothetical protein
MGKVFDGVGFSGFDTKSVRRRPVLTLNVVGSFGGDNGVVGRVLSTGELGNPGLGVEGADFGALALGRIACAGRCGSMKLVLTMAMLLIPC